MTEDRPWMPVAASFAPWAVFIVAGAMAGDVRLAAFAAGGFFGVALPSMAPLAAARPGVSRVLTTVAMAAVAASAAVAIVRSDDAQAGLHILLVPMVALPFALVLWIGRLVVERRRAVAAGLPHALAPASERVGALVIDLFAVGAPLILPAMVLSDAGLEPLAAVGSFAALTAYLAAMTATRAQTFGQRLLGIAVVDEETRAPCPAGRALLRSGIVAFEVSAAGTITFAPLALAELVSVLATGRSLTDRLLHTAVVNAGENRPNV